MFNELPWHDAELKEIHIDRNDPGIIDEVCIVIGWPDGSVNQIIFHDCYACVTQLNFGIIATETIDSANCLGASSEIDEIRNKWMKIGTDIEALKQYKIVTNSTNSHISIIALGFRIINHGECLKEKITP